MSRPLRIGPWKRADGVAPKADRTWNGVVYHSKGEMKYAQQLELLTKIQGPERVAKWSRQVAVPLIVNGSHLCNYVIDFFVETADGKRFYVECKGHEEEVWKLKHRLFSLLYPEKKLIVVKL